MSAIDLPAGIVWLDDGRLGVAIVQGDPNMVQHPELPMFIAPQVWAQYDKPCETCEGHGQLWHIGTISKGPSAWKPCPDCRDGRQVWTVRWPCPSGDCDDGTHRVRGEGVGACVVCNGAGILSARATIQVVPVVDGHSDDRPPTFPYLTVYRPERQVVYVTEHKGVRLPLDPLPTPGRDYAVIVAE